MNKDDRFANDRRATDAPVQAVARRIINRKRIKRLISLLCAIVMFMTVNGLRLDAHTLEHIPTCGYEEHTHSDACYDENMQPVCGLDEHVHTDACYQEPPQSKDEDVDGAGDADEPEAIDITPVDAAYSEADEQFLNEDGDAAFDADVFDTSAPEQTESLAEPAPQEAAQTPSFSFADRDYMLASEIAPAAGLDLGQVVDVAAVENDESQAGCLGIERLDGDWLIYAAREFDEAELAFFIGDAIETVKLTDGAPLTAQESAEAGAAEADPGLEADYDAGETGDPAVDSAPEAMAEEGQGVVDANAAETDENAIGDDASEAGDGEASVEMPADEADMPAGEDVDAQGDVDTAGEGEQTEVADPETDEVKEDTGAAGGDAENEDAAGTDDADTTDGADADPDDAETKEGDDQNEAADDAEADKTKPDDAGADETKSDDVEADETKPDDAETDETKSDDAAADDDEADDAETDETKSDDAEADDAEADDAEADGSEPDEGEAPSGAYAGGEARRLTVDLAEAEYPLSLRALLESLSAAPEAETEPEDAETPAQAEDTPEADEGASEAADEGASGADEQASDGVAAEDVAITAVDVVVGEDETALGDGAPEIDANALLALPVDYDASLLSIEATEDDQLITPIAAFEETEIAVGGIYTIALLNGAAPEAPVAMPAQSFEGATDYILVKVEAGEGAFPEGTTMSLEDVLDEGTLSDIGDAAVTEDFVEVKRVHAVDITFKDADGREIEPLIPISVVMSMREAALDGDAQDEAAPEENTVVVHVDNDGNVAVVESADAVGAVATDDAEAPAATGDAVGDAVGDVVGDAAAAAEGVGFMADAFSVYGLVVTQRIETRFITELGETYDITVTYGPEALIPGSASLSVREIEGDEAQDYLQRTEETLDSAQMITMARFFDIKIMDGEEEVHPAAPVVVTATLAKDDDANTPADGTPVPCAVHFDGEQPDLVNATEADEAVTFRAEGFSVWGVVYTVDFHYGVDGQTYDFSIPGGDVVTLRNLVEALGVLDDSRNDATADVEKFFNNIKSVGFSDESLVQVAKIEQDTTVGALREALSIESEYSAALTADERAEIDARELKAGDWALFSLKPFTSDETLTINLKTEETFTIAVTDAQIQTHYISADGTAYKITVTFGPESGIPVDARLKVTEIEKDAIGWNMYCSQSKLAMGLELDSTVDFARFFDIEIQKDGEKIEPLAPVSVNIELANAPETTDNELKVVHFVEDSPAVMDSEPAETEETAVHDDAPVIAEIPEIIRNVQVEKTSGNAEGAMLVQFEAASFSTWGVLTYPTAARFTGEPSSLVGKGFTLSHNNRYLTSNPGLNDPERLLETSDESQAAIWHLKYVNNGQNFALYTIDSSGNVQELVYDKRGADSANIRLATQGSGNWTNVTKNSDGTYSFQSHNRDGSYYLNHWGSDYKNGFAGYTGHNDDDHLVVKVVDYPQPKPSDTNDQNKDEHFVVLKKNDKYYLVKNDGSLEEVEVVNDNGERKFLIKDEPMAWSIVTENGNQYIQHKSYAKRVEPRQKYPTRWYYSYISPMEEKGFADPTVIKPYDPEDQYPYENEEDFEKQLADITRGNDEKKSNSRIILEQSGDGTYRIKSAVNGGYYIGVSDDGTHVTGQESFADSAEVIFGNVQLYRYSDTAEERARRNVVNHIDIGIEASARLSIPLAPQTYYTASGPVTLNNVEMVTVTEPVDIGTEDIKKAKLTAYTEGANGLKREKNDVYYITGYSGNAKTEISAAQVRIEGQFKVADVEDYTGYDPFETDDNYRQKRLNNRVWYNIVVEKEVTFHLKKMGCSFTMPTTRS